MIISTVALKGGAGKTTVAFNLAVYFAKIQSKSVLIIDADVNKHMQKIGAIRSKNEINLAKINYVELDTSEKLYQHFEELAARYDVVIIDGRPAVDDLVTTIISISDLCIIPVKPSPLDMWANDEVFIDRYIDVKIEDPTTYGVFLLNCVKPNTNLAYECRLELEGFKESTEIPILKTELSDRVDYAKSFVSGLGALEIKNYKAKAEVKRLGDEIVKHIEKLK